MSTTSNSANDSAAAASSASTLMILRRTPPADTTRKRSIAVWTPPNVEAPLTDGTIRLMRKAWWTDSRGVARMSSWMPGLLLGGRGGAGGGGGGGGGGPATNPRIPRARADVRQRRRPRRTGVTQRAPA